MKEQWNFRFITLLFVFHGTIVDGEERCAKNRVRNTSCTVLPQIADKRDDTQENIYAGKSLEDIESKYYPPCVEERATFMAPFEISLWKEHPYAQIAEKTHGHFKSTPYTILPYSTVAIPFRWMLRKTVEGENHDKGYAEIYRFRYDADREPDLKQNPNWSSGKIKWVQEGTNQQVILDTFFSAIKPIQSLIFFYAKRTPMAEDGRRVIVGVGRVESVGGSIEYRYKGGKKPQGKLSGCLWERNVEHSIRPENNIGFLLPYHELLDIAETDDGIDTASCTAFAPDEYFEQFSYGSELLPHDGAIASLLALESAIRTMRKHLDFPWEAYLQWIDNELNRLWNVRGPFPGLGAALHAFGIPNANLLAWHLAGDEEKVSDPWCKLTLLLGNSSSLPKHLAEAFGPTLQKKWELLPKTRRNLLMLLARFSLNNDQALRWYQITERSNLGINLHDSEILENPYRIFEEDRLQVDPIAFTVVDRGMFPPEKLRQEFPIPEPSRINEAIDSRRVRSLMVEILETAAGEGHTILPLDWLIQRARNLPIDPKCPLDFDTLPVIQPSLAPLIAMVDLNLGASAFQLYRYAETSSLIRDKIRKRASGRANVGEMDWSVLIDQALDAGHPKSELDEDDILARQEKAEALAQLYSSRVCVLLGSAGTGKSTLIKALCQIESVVSDEVLLLAPTGKARVRLEEASGMHGYGQTIAQFLYRYHRYNGRTGRYYINKNASRCSNFKTVVVDECSMLTEEQLAALLDALTGVERLILVGDAGQLPPIGAGRPFVDIVEFLKPSYIESLSPRVDGSYAELRVNMRHRQRELSSNVDGYLNRTDSKRLKPNYPMDRLDVGLANVFRGIPLDAGSDEVWQSIKKGNSPFVKLVRWNKPEQLEELLISELTDELALSSYDDEVGFGVSIGGTAVNTPSGTYVYFNPRYGGNPGAAEKAHNWQILTPVRQNQAGVLALNRAIQKKFRKQCIDLAHETGYRKKIPAPSGSENIIYGDKVINVTNSDDRPVYPDKESKYVANGDIGVVTGHFKTKKRNWRPVNLEVELASQLGYSYKYMNWEFDSQDNAPPLELAYALTIHKTQGSEFETTFLIVPNPCRLLSREMLYTALTRHKKKVVIFHQGEFRDLQSYTREEASEVARRMTYLFSPSSPAEVQIRNRKVFLDENLINMTERGELVRSKSERIIADKLHQNGIDYQYEHPLNLGDTEYFPDFTVVDDDSGIAWYWEHNSLLDNSESQQRWERKLKNYRGEGIVPIDDFENESCNGILLISNEKQGVGLDLDEIAINIKAIKEM